MPKLKTNRAAAKRFRFTATGKVKRAQANKNHILTKKSQDRKRRLRGITMMHENDLREVRTLLPYAK